MTFSLQNRKPTWAATTWSPFNLACEESASNRAAHALGWPVIDRCELTQSLKAAFARAHMMQSYGVFMTDAFHFKPWVNNEFNRQLLALHCT